MLAELPSLTADIWVVIIGFSAVMALLARRISEQFGVSLFAALAVGSYLGNIAARLADMIPVTQHITAGVLTDSVLATFAGMGAAFAVWAAINLVHSHFAEIHGIKKMQKMTQQSPAGQSSPTNRNLKAAPSRST